MKYRKLPVEVEAVEFFCVDMDDKGGCYGTPREDDNGVEHLITIHGIRTLEGFMKIKNGDMIITGIEGEKYACRRDIFDKTYEPA